MDDKKKTFKKPRYSSGEIFYPEEFRGAEEKLLVKRRKAARLEGAAAEKTEVGVALSGGGIRSATLSLGFFQGFAKQDFLKEIDFLSTVSGGGYFGAFLGTLFSPIAWVDPNKKISFVGKLASGFKKAFSLFTKESDEEKPEEVETSFGKVQELLRNNSSKPLKWLRNHGRYLIPSGEVDPLTYLGVFFRNWLSVQSVIFLIALLIAQSLVILKNWMVPHCLSLPSLFGCDPGPLFVLSLAILVLAVIPSNFGYWLCLDGKGFSRAVPFLAMILACTLSSILAVYFFNGIGCRDYRWLGDLFAGLGLSLVMTMVYFCLFFVWRLFDKKRRAVSPGIQSIKLLDPAIFREEFTKILNFSFPLFVISLVLASADSIILNFVFVKNGDNELIPFLASLFGILPLGFLSDVLKPFFKKGLKENPIFIGIVVAAVLDVIWLGAIFILALWITNLLSKMESNCFDLFKTAYFSEGLWGVLFLFCLLAARNISFLNFSSEHYFYRDRLVNSYLRAARLYFQDENLPQDNRSDMALEHYRPYEKGAPLHLINVTINETVVGPNQGVQHDRKGVPMAVGPAGFSIGLDDHSLWTDPSRKWVKPVSPGNDFHALLDVRDQGQHPVEALTLGSWIAVSGAAIGTGLGSYTNLFFSLLFGLANIRLGYWWDSHINRQKGSNKSEMFSRSVDRLIRYFFPVQMALKDEFTASFHGTDGRLWYLSDGGHCENTGCYELLRRQVPFIIYCDNGEDPHYQFDDFAKLVLKARNDFQTEIQFFTQEELKRLGPELSNYVGTIQDFRPAKPIKDNTYFKKYAFLAWAIYPNGERSILLILKPCLTGIEPLDLINYKANNPSFPNETTANQFFSEAEWEAYRKLGEIMADKVFERSPKNHRSSLYNGIRNLLKPKITKGP